MECKVPSSSFSNYRANGTHNTVVQTKNKAATFRHKTVMCIFTLSRALITLGYRLQAKNEWLTEQAVSCNPYNDECLRLNRQQHMIGWLSSQSLFTTHHEPTRDERERSETWNQVGSFLVKEYFLETDSDANDLSLVSAKSRGVFWRKWYMVLFYRLKKQLCHWPAQNSSKCPSR